MHYISVFGLCSFGAQAVVELCSTQSKTNRLADMTEGLAYPLGKKMYKATDLYHLYDLLYPKGKSRNRRFLYVHRDDLAPI